MARQTTSGIFWQGVRDGLPFLLVVVPFAILFGVTSVEAGLGVYEALAFSFVLAGAAQFTALQLLSEGVPATLVLLSALAINLRVAMYSASLTPYLGRARLWERALAAYFIVDQTYGCSVLAFERNPKWGLRQRMAYYWGAVVPVCPVWYASTFAGAAMGKAIPESMALDFALPITFLAMTIPMLRTMAHVLAAVAAVIVAIAFAFLPFSLGLLAGGCAGIAAGAEVERRVKRAAKK
ncbi:MAG: AzlC family ABC transporter permease [Roseovarius sp.]|nr:AzlC family ABC transporter permease [Roseovarius sp.]MCY4290205.1 AzlC family ABC transporter permease [Roseovarius sp.]